MKLVFIQNHSPRKKGDVVTFETREEIRTANWYLANQIAKLCECDNAKQTGCAGCDKKAQEAKVEEELPTVGEKVVTPKATGKKK